MRVVSAFYYNYFRPLLAISLFACWLLWNYGSWEFIVVLFWTKVITNVIIGIFVSVFSPDQFVFYNNLGYAKLKLLVLTFLLDMGIWTLLVFLTIKFFL